MVMVRHAVITKVRLALRRSEKQMIRMSNEQLYSLTSVAIRPHIQNGQCIFQRGAITDITNQLYKSKDYTCELKDLQSLSCCINDNDTILRSIMYGINLENG